MATSLDLLDKKILTVLNSDVRAGFSEIAKRLKTSKEVINYRVKRLEKQGIIREYVTIFGFGYWASKVLVDFAKIDRRGEKDVLDYLRGHPNVNWVTPCTGGWDLAFAIMAKDPSHFDSIMREILGKIGKYIQDYKMATSIGSHTYGHTYILGSVKESAKAKRNVVGQIDFDEKDKAIAKVLHKDARARLTDIYEKTGIPIDTIKYRVKKMEKSCIIKRYRLVLDTSKLGFHRYEVFLRCVNLTDAMIASFEEYARQNPNIEYFCRCTGAWDIELTVHLRTSDELREFILDVKEKFGEHIQRFETITLFETFNFVYLPEELR